MSMTEMSAAPPSPSAAGCTPTDTGGAVDVTSLFRSISSKLPLGELIRHDEFTMQEALAALQVMDPKMDAGVGAEKVYNLDEGLAIEALKPDSELDMCTILVILDRLFTLEAMFQQGSSPAQTLCTSVYLASWQDLTHPYFRPLCEAIAATVGLVAKFICDVGVFDDEDFTYRLFNIRAPKENTNKQLLQTLLGLETGLREWLSDVNDGGEGPQTEDTPPGVGVSSSPPSSSAGSSRRSFESSAQFPFHDREKDRPLAEALLTRLVFRRHYFLAHRNLFNSKLGAAQENIAQARKALEHMCSAESWQATQDELDRVGSPEVGAFLLDASRRFTSPSSPKLLYLSTLEESRLFFASQLYRLHELIQLVASAGSMPRLHEVRLFVSRMVLDQTPPCVVVRTHTWFALYRENKLLGQPMPDVVRSHLTLLWNVPPQHPLLDLPLTRELVIFYGQLALRQMHRLCFNRSRQRTKLIEELREWAEAQRHAMHADAAVGALSVHYMDSKGEVHISETPSNPRMWGSLMQLEAGEAMCEFVSLALELDLLESSEMCQTYLYLDFLSHQILEDLEKLLSVQIEVDPQVLSNGKSMSKAARKKQARAREALLILLRHQRIIVSSALYMYQGIGRMLCGLSLPSLLGVQCNSTNPHCAGPATYFEHRFAPLNVVPFPPSLSYESFAKVVSVQDDTVRDGLLEQATKLFAQATKQFKGLLESTTPELCPLPEHLIRSAMKVSIANASEIFAWKRARLADPNCERTCSVLDYGHPVFRRVHFEPPTQSS